LVIAPKDPEPGLVLEVKAIDATEGRPEGLVFPYASFAVSVAVTEDPEFTLPLEILTTEVAVE
jgi:hypothetical protein